MALTGQLLAQRLHPLQRSGSIAEIQLDVTIGRPKSGERNHHLWRS
jgi:hypothetical protein